MNNKKITLIITICFILSIFTACSPDKTSITANEFKKAMSKDNFKVTNYKSHFKGYKYISHVYIARNEKKEFDILFFEIDNDKNAELVFNNYKTIFNDSKESNGSETEQEKNNYTTYKLTTKHDFKFISKVDNTILYIDASSKYNSKIENIISELGY